jgi:hypothetical protein
MKNKNDVKNEIIEGKADFKGCLHSFPKIMVKICFAIDVGVSKDEILKKISDETVRKAITYYAENLEEAREILLPYTIATEQYPYTR